MWPLVAALAVVCATLVALAWIFSRGGSTEVDAEQLAEAVATVIADDLAEDGPISVALRGRGRLQ